MLKKYKESEYAIKISELWKKLDLNITVSGSIESDILMSPETGNFFNQPLRSPFRVVIKVTF